MRKTTSTVEDYVAQLALVCSAAEAAELLGVTTARVKQFCHAGRLAAKKCGRDWVVCRAAAVALAAIERPSGVHVTQSQVSGTRKTTGAENKSARKNAGKRGK